MRLQLRPGITCLFGVFALVFLLVPAGAGADPHAVQIDEVMAGAFGRLDLQLVELRLDGCQADWGDGALLAFFDADGDPVGTAAFPADTPTFCQSVLVATQAYADLPGVADPNFLMPPFLTPVSGKVCFQNPAAVPPVNLCLSYGAFTGDSDQGSAANAPALVPTRTCSLERVALFDWFGNPNFNEDFGLSLPSPDFSSFNIPPRFNDVPLTSPFALSVEALFNAGVTGGCGNGAFCPGQAVTREQMAVLLLRSLEGPAFMPPACTSPAFGDVPCSSPFAPWINELAARGITGGCGGGNFCPGVAVTREQMAVLLLLALEEPGFTPPACTSPVFGDVPCSSGFAPWINELAARGITGGCGGGNFCPGTAVTREQMAAFLTFTFELPVPSFDCNDGPLPPENPGGQDDHGDTPATATPILPGVPVAGVLEDSNDQDVFSFQAGQGELYSAEAPIAGRSQGASLLILDANGENIDMDFSTSADRVLFRTPSSGTFLIVVLPFLPGNSYELLLQGPIADDHGEDRMTATPLPLNTPTAGAAQETFDHDFFSFAAEAGKTYTFRVTGQRPFSPHVRITDAAGQLVASDNPDLSSGPLALAVFVAPLTGTLFAEVSSSISFELVIGGPGPYEVLVSGPFDDAPGATAATAAPLVAGTPVESQIPQGNVDVFSFTAQAGEAYLLELTGLAPHAGLTLELLGSDGTTVLGSTTFFGERRDGLVLTPAANGTFFGRVSGGPAAYRIVFSGPLADDHGDTSADATPLPGDATEVPGSLELPEDVDVFSFAVTAFDVFRVEVTGAFSPVIRVFDAGGNTIASGSLRVLLRPEVSGTLFVEAGPPGLAPRTGSYQIRVRTLADDHGDWADEATLVIPGAAAVPGMIDFLQDWDFFAFDAVQGEVHTIRVQVPAGQSPGTIQLFDTDGETPLGTESAVPLRFRVPATGRYFLRVRGSLGATYNLVIGPGVTP